MEIKTKDTTNNPGNQILSSCKTVKTPLNKILKNSSMKNLINDAIVRTNQITCLTYEFIKLYVLDCFNNNKELPMINEKFILDCQNVLCDKSKKGRKSKTESDYLSEFYDSHFKDLVDFRVSKSNLTQILKDESKRMKTCYENSVQTNYFNFLFRYINCIFIDEHQTTIDNLKTDEDKKKYMRELKTELKEVKNDLLNNTLKSNEKYHKWIKESYDKIIPSYDSLKKIEKDEVSYHYDIKVSSLKYLKYLLVMNNHLEEKGKKMFNPLPLRHSLIPSFIYIDTTAIVELADDLEDKNYYRNHIVENQPFLWDKYFNMGKKIFKNKTNYVFNYTIQTNGIDTSILFKRKDLKDENGHNKKEKKTKKSNKVNEEFKYLENYKQFELLEIKNNNNIVYCDPGKCRLLYMLDEVNNKIFTYTNKQRVFETQRLKYEHINKKMRKESGIEEKENILSNCCGKTCNVEKFKEYIKTKEQLRKEIETFYLNEKFRKFKMRVFINTKRSEQKLINAIKDKYTITNHRTKTTTKPLIVIGNWCISHQMRNMMSSPCIGLKRLLNKNFNMLTMDEFRTSCLSHLNEERVENAIDKITNKKIHSVLILKEKEKVIGYINRDRNAVYNYKKVFESYMTTGCRPQRFDRSYKLE